MITIFVCRSAERPDMAALDGSGWSCHSSDQLGRAYNGLATYFKGTTISPNIYWSYWLFSFSANMISPFPLFEIQTLNLSLKDVQAVDFRSIVSTILSPQLLRNQFKLFAANEKFFFESSECKVIKAY